MRYSPSISTCAGFKSAWISVSGGIVRDACSRRAPVARAHAAVAGAASARTARSSAGRRRATGSRMLRRSVRRSPGRARATSSGTPRSRWPVAAVPPARTRARPHRPRTDQARHDRSVCAPQQSRFARHRQARPIESCVARRPWRAVPLQPRCIRESRKTWHLGGAGGDALRSCHSQPTLGALRGRLIATRNVALFRHGPRHIRVRLPGRG